MTTSPQYPDHFIDRLHLLWGAGFLSPGGRDEVLKIVEGLDLAGKHLLDIGCGTGGPAMVLAKDCGAKVNGIDIESALIKRALANAKEAALDDNVSFKLVEPGPLPFDDHSLDAVFSKDSLIHVTDKSAMFKDIKRVLKPGGILAMSDWLKGEGNEAMAALETYRQHGHLDFTMATAADTESMLKAAGFADIKSLDRKTWYEKRARKESEQIDGPLKEQLIKAAGEIIYTEWAKGRRALAQAVEGGGLRPTHFRAVV
ncbi:MAG: class I SAM-dependent methyltransferase [Geminicoccales bacterium]